MASSGEPGRREAPHSADCARLLRVAQRVLVRVGYRATTLEGIARSADVDVAAVRACFATKQDVVIAVNDQLVADQAPLMRQLRTVLATRDQAALSVWLGCALEWWEQHLDVLGPLREAGVVDIGLGQRMGAIFEASIDRASAAFRDLPEPRYTERRARLQTLMMQLDQFFLARLTAADGAIDRDDVISRVSAVWVPLLQG